MSVQISRFIEEFSSKENKMKLIKQVKDCSNLYRFLKLFLLFGIEMRHSGRNKSSKTVATIMNIFMKIVWIVSFTLMTTKFYFKADYKENFKHFLNTLFYYFACFIMWYYVIKYESKFMQEVKKMNALERKFNSGSDRKFILCCNLFFILICISFICSHAHDYDSPSLKEGLKIFTFNKIDFNNVHWSISFVLWYIYRFFIFYGHLFACCFALFYIIICRSMTMMLSKHVKNNECILKENFITAEQCNACFARYDAILATLVTFNDVLSIPIFFENFLAASSVLWVTIYSWKSQRLPSLGHIFTLLVNIILFTGTVFTASDVNEADKKAKAFNIKILRSLDTKNRRKIKESFEMLSQVSHAPAFAMTGMNFYEYKRGFYLTAIGCFMTYALLIINL